MSGSPEQASANRQIAAAYDSVARTYEAGVAGDGWMRHILWSRFRSLFRCGDCVLDLTAGTGQDAIFLARRGVHVTAIDLSPAMIASLQEKARREGLEKSIRCRVGDCLDLGAFAAGQFDGAISTFAGLSTVPDLSRLSQEVARVLRPGGTLIVHMLNRFSLWEWLWLLRRFRLAEAASLPAQKTRSFKIGETTVHHWLNYPLPTYRRFFASLYNLRAVRGMGILRPPHTYEGEWLSPQAARRLGRLEAQIAGMRPLWNCGRFFLLEMRRRPVVS